MFLGLITEVTFYLSVPEVGSNFPRLVNIAHGVARLAIGWTVIATDPSINAPNIIISYPNLLFLG